MLGDPGAWGTRTLDTLFAELAVYGPVLGCAGAATALVVAILAAALRHARRGAWAQRARWIEIIPAPQVDPDGAVALWATLYGLRRNRLTRLWRGQEHLGFEILADADGPRFGFWVPATLTEGFVANQVRAAWPGTQVRVHPSPPSPLPRADTPRRQPAGVNRAGGGPGAGPPAESGSGGGSARGGPVVCVVGRLRLGASPALGLKTEHRIDPLRMVLAALGQLHPGQSACVQVLARPLASRARLHRAAAGLLAARPTGLRLPVWMLTELGRAMAQETLNLFHPATAHTSTHHHYHRGGHSGSREPGSGRGSAQVARRADLSAAVRPRTSGAAQLWTVQVRYAAAYLPHPPDNRDESGAGRVEGRREWARREWARVWCRGRAGQIGAAFAVFTSHNHLRRRLTGPDPDPGTDAGGGSLVRRVLMRVWGRCARARAGWARRAIIGRWMSRRWAGFGGGQSFTGAELAALAHLPTDPRIPGLVRAGAHQIAPPRQVPTGGPEAKILGDATTGRPRAVAVPVADCCCHLHIPGATGNGKTTLIAQLCLADIRRRLALIQIGRASCRERV